MKKLLNRLGDSFLALLMGILVCITVGGVFMRYVMNAPWHWVEEMSGLLMVWIVFCGVFFAERDNENLTITFLSDAMKPRLRHLNVIVMTLLSVAVLGVAAWWSWGLAETVQARMTRILGVSLFWIYVPVSLGFVATALLMLKRLFSPQTQADDAGDVQ